MTAFDEPLVEVTVRTLEDMCFVCAEPRVGVTQRDAKADAGAPRAEPVSGPGTLVPDVIVEVGFDHGGRADVYLYVDAVSRGR